MNQHLRTRALGLAAAIAVVAVAIAPATMAYANEDADAALEEIDELVDDWEDGFLSAEEALEFIDEVIHDLPAGARTGVLAEIDQIVHEWEDGDLTAEEAMEMIEALVHGPGGHDDEPADEEQAGEVAPAVTGSGGFSPAGSSNALIIAGLATAVALLLGGARVVTARQRAS